MMNARMAAAPGIRRNVTRRACQAVLILGVLLPPRARGQFDADEVLQQARRKIVANLE